MAASMQNVNKPFLGGISYYLIIYFAVGGFRSNSISVCAGSSAAASLGADGRFYIYLVAGMP